MERRLSAVLIADIVGYGRLSQVDEEGTRARFQADLHEVFEPTIAAHHGRLIKTMGDGVLVEFHSVVDAVRCAIVVVRAKAERNAGVPEDRRLVFRIGINLGDVIVEGDDIHGDGVNIAARLEGLAEPGGIVLSGAAYDQVKTKIAIGYAYIGERPVKNVAEPVRIYRVLMDPKYAGRTIDATNEATRPWRRPVIAAGVLLLVVVVGAMAWLRPWEPRLEPNLLPPDEPSIAVLPFTNMSGDPQQDYFSDGMTDDLITDLSQISGLFIIARNSTFAYKGRSVDIRKVAKELGVRYVLEGSVQRAADRIRINAQLIDATTGGHRWADRFDGSLADIFALQDQVTHSIADALALRLANPEQLSLGRQETGVPAAYDAFLRGWEHLQRLTPGDFAKAIPALQEAIKLDPDYGRANAALAWVYFNSYQSGWSDSLGLSSPQARERAAHYLEEARKHSTALSHQTAGLMLWDGSQYDDAAAEFKDAIALDPGDALSYAYMGLTLTSAGRAAEAVPFIRTAMRLDPHHPPLFMFILGLAQFDLEQFEEAAATLEAATRRNPDNEFPFRLLAATYGLLGRKQDAATAIAKFNDIVVSRGGIPTTIWSAVSPGIWANTDLKRIRKGLRLAGVPDSLFGSDFAARNKLTANEIRTLFFGHRLHGGAARRGEDRAASITKEGVASMSGDWVLGGGALSGGIAQFDGDALCCKFGVVSYCGLVLHNPGGTRANENQFMWDLGSTYSFSQVE